MPGQKLLLIILESRGGRRGERIFAKSGSPGNAGNADVTDKQQVNAMVEAVEEKFGSLDILVPNATGPQPQKQLKTMMQIFTGKCTNFLSSVFPLAQAALPGMKAWLGKNR